MGEIEREREYLGSKSDVFGQRAGADSSKAVDNAYLTLLRAKCARLLHPPNLNSKPDSQESQPESLKPDSLSLSLASGP